MRTDIVATLAKLQGRRRERVLDGEVKRIVAARRREARVAAAADARRRELAASLGVAPGTVVTVQDSLDAGDCAAQTARVRDLVGADSAPVEEVYRLLLHHSPHLLSYAQRAATVAAKRATA